MRILIWSNAPFCNTGYGGQVKQLIPHLTNAGHDVGVVANYGLSGNVINHNGIPIFPLRESRQNRDVISAYAKRFNADVVISLYDIWALPPNTKQLLSVPWIAMIPVDGAPVSPMMISRMRDVDYIVSYSRFGEAEIRSAGFENTFIPHGINTDIFKPGDKKAIREKLGIPDDIFFISTVAANKGIPPRKSWPELIQAYQMFREKHPDSLLYIHSTKTPYGSNGEGMYFDQLIETLGIPSNAFAWPDADAYKLGVPDRGMAEIYQASDAMLLPSRGEGFGLPLLEAQACGCPIICGDNSSQSELCVNGIAVEPLQRQWLPQLQYFWQIPSIQKIADALEEIYDWTNGERKRNALMGIEFAKDYEMKTVFERYWTPFLEHVEATLW